jgi:hypothetical protein
MESSVKDWKALTIRLSPDVYRMVQRDALRNAHNFHGKPGILLRAIVNDFYGMGDAFTLDMIQENLGNNDGTD